MKLTREQQIIVEENYGLIQSFARKWYWKLNKTVEFDDLVQVASIGFMKALPTYDSSKGAIGTYMGFNINSYIRHYINSKSNKSYLKENPSGNIYQVGEISYWLSYEIEEYIVNKCLIDDIIDKVKGRFDDKQIEIIQKYLSKEHTQSDIAQEYKVSRQAINNLIIKFRKHISIHISKEDLIA